MQTFNIAIIGCGGVSRLHFEGYLPHPERVRIVAACDPDPERLDQARRKYRVPATFTSLEDTLRGADWEVAVVCTPTPVREAVIAPLAAAGKQIFVEKPLADTRAEAGRMVAACQRSGVTLAVDQNFRYHYPFSIARRLIRDGKLGKVHTLLHRDLTFRQDAGWRIHCPRHALSVMGIHWLDGFRWVLQQEAVSIFCRTTSSPAVTCVGDTDASVQIVFQEGTTVSYTQSFSSPVKQTDTLILGETGALSLDYRGASLFNRERGAEPVERWDIPVDRSHKSRATFKALNQLLTSLERETEPGNSGRDNLNTVALLDGAYRSAETQQAVALGSPEKM